MLAFDELKQLVEHGEVDTVVVAFTDMQGRLMGKRLHGEFFVEEMEAEHPVEGCNYLLALEMEMDPVPGLRDRELGAGLRRLRDHARPGTLRRIPWLEATALVLGDVLWHDGSPVAPSPRQVLRAQMERAAALGFTPMVGSELEFYLLKETFAEAHAKGYRDLTPSVPYILDYHILGTTYDEPLIRAIRNGMHAAGIKVETSKGEAWPGQQEINFRFADALTMADNHVVYKNGAKEIAFQHGCSITFMAKPFHDWIGNSCHIHSSLLRDGEAAFADDETLFGQWLAGQIACFARAGGVLRADDQLVQALRGGQLGADDARLGQRQPHLRLPRRRSRQGRRVETRIPGGDVNPYLAVRRGDRGRAARHRARRSSRRRRCRATPTSRTPSASRRRCARRSRRSRAATMARGALGDQVVDHYLNYARTEQALFDRFVTY